MKNLQVDLIVTRNGYGFGYDWQMSVKRGEEEKIFYLGQDAKVCSRILGMTGREVAQHVGSNDLNLLSTRQAIAEMILQTFGVTDDNEDELFNTPPWELAAE